MTIAGSGTREDRGSSRQRAISPRDERSAV